MILNAAQARLAVGISDTITTEERALLEILLPMVDDAIAKFIHYDPQYRVISAGEWYPRTAQMVPGLSTSVYETTATHAYEHRLNTSTSLQLAVLPVRSIQEIRIDYAGGFGQKPDTFGNDKIKVAGTDYWQEYTTDGLNESGLVYGITGWPTEPGTVRVKYTAGYTKQELQGQSRTSITDPELGSAGSGLNASGITAGAMLTLVKAFKTVKMNQKQARIGYTGGPMSSESMGRYSYSAAMVQAMTGMQLVVPVEAQRHLERFVHWGMMAL